MIPTKKQLEKCVSDHRDEGLVGELICRKISIHITKLIARTNLTPNEITYFSFLFGFAGAILIIYNHLVLAGLVVFFSYILDNVDGEIARLKKMGSSYGAFYDETLDRIKEGWIIFAIAYALYPQTSNVVVWMIGFAAVFSILMTNLTVQAASRVGGLRKKHGSIRIIKRLQKLGIKQSYLTLGIDAQYFIIMLGCIFNQLFLLLLFFAVIQNLYWTAVFLMVSR